jgi:hypothetical protein
MNMIKVDCRVIRGKLLNYCDEFVTQIRNTIYAHITAINAGISKELTTLIDSIGSRAENEQKLVDLDKIIQDIKGTDYERISGNYKDLIQWLMMFYNTKHKIKEDDLKTIHNTADNVHSVMSKVEERENRLIMEREEIEKRLKQKKADFMKKVTELSERVKTLKDVSGLFMPKKYA